MLVAEWKDVPELDQPTDVVSVNYFYSRESEMIFLNVLLV